MLLDDLDRHGVGVGLAAELEEEALLGGAGGDARRVEQLDQLEPALHLLGGRAAALGDLGELGPEVAVLVEVADDLRADPAQARVIGREPQLLLEVVAQGGGGADDVLEGQVVVLLLGDERALLVVVEEHRRQVERQVVGLPLVAGDLGHRLRGRGGRLGLPRSRRPLAVDRDFLEQRVLQELLLHDLLQLEGGELQELDGLLEERRHDDPLGHPLGEARLHRHPLGSLRP